MTANMRNFHVLHGKSSLRSSVAAWAAGLGSLLVGGEVEGDEEKEV